MNTITIETDEPVVVIPIHEYEGMKETIEILSSNPGILEDLNKERKEIEDGNYVKYEDFKEKNKI